MSSSLRIPIEEARSLLEKQTAEERLLWAFQQFQEGFVITTSFGIQSSVLLHMLQKLQKECLIPVFWIDTGYLPKETYCYAEQLMNLLKIDLKVCQSNFSPARMEALYGRLWETNSIEDLEKYHQIRKVEPLEESLKKFNVTCWASGVRGNQTQHRSAMNFLDPIRERLSVRPLLDWNNKDIYYYMKEHDLPQHPLFEQGFSTVGDWHSSAPEEQGMKGRDTRFGGLKEECGIHLPGYLGEGI